MLRVILLVSALVASSALSAHANNGRDNARAECVRLADAQKFGDRRIQRRNFIQDCLIDRGFNM
jgi:hypothetical protein